jgi:predicted DNA-binding transcriptional regulator YafY
MDKEYTTTELSEMFGVSSRTIQRHIASIADDLSANSKGYKVPKLIALYISEKYGYNFEEDNKRQDVRTEYFTEEEYQEFHKRLLEYRFLKEQLTISKEFLDSLKNELEYHKSAYFRQLDIHEKLIDSVKQRNFIEAKEKGMDR